MGYFSGLQMENVLRQERRDLSHLENWAAGPLDYPDRGSNAQVTYPPPKGWEPPRKIAYDFEGGESPTRGGVKRVDRDLFQKYAVQALRNGAEAQGANLVWDLTKGSKYPCTKPYDAFRLQTGAEETGVFANYTKGRVTKHKGTWGAQAQIILRVRCRKCGGCATFREKMWIARTMAEMNEAIQDGLRVWFVTLTSGRTMRPYIDKRASVLALSKGVIFDRLSDPEKFAYRARVFKPEITKYVKRLRNGVGKRHKPRLRYVAVTEPHKSWHCHAHMAIIELDPDQPVSERLLRDRWRNATVWDPRSKKYKVRGSRGFCQANLVDPDKRRDATWYVAKYVAKEHTTVQASVRWGQCDTAAQKRAEQSRGENPPPPKQQKPTSCTSDQGIGHFQFWFLLWCALSIQDGARAVHARGSPGSPRRATF